MAWQVVLGALGGALVDGAFSLYNSNKMLKENQASIDRWKQAANQYTGENAANKNLAEGRKRGIQMNQMAMDASTANPSNAENTAFMNAQAGTLQNAANNNYANAYQTGMSQSDMLNKANLNAIKQQEEMNRKQNETMYGVRSQFGKGLMDTIGSAVQTGQAVSDENEKQSPDSPELPRADIEDSLRQLKAVWYEYKHPGENGEDDKEHCGFTAQNAEETPLFENCVIEDYDGLKRIDRWRLQESITAATAELQKEIDELSNNNVKVNELPIRKTVHKEE